MNEYRSPYNEGFVYALNGGLRRSKPEPLTTGGVRVWSGLKSLGLAGSEVICGSDTIKFNSTFLGFSIDNLTKVVYTPKCEQEKLTARNRPPKIVSFGG